MPNSYILGLVNIKNPVEVVSTVIFTNYPVIVADILSTMSG